MPQKLKPSYKFNETQLEQLKQIVPEAFKDGMLDFNSLYDALGDYNEEDSIEMDDNFYGLYWPGKRAAKRAAAIPPRGTLIPVKGDGVDEENTKNIYIEGDNLEVLKLLQKSYAGKIKMIYIDPPYNTGKDFVYNDDFSVSSDQWLVDSGQVDEQGEKIIAKANSRADGRFHSKWLSMMYPRLKLAHSLLRDDGVIFISIDDNEANNLKTICDEIFGEENFVDCFYIQVRYASKSLNEKDDFQKLIEQVLIYSKQKDFFRPNKPFNEYDIDKFNNEIIELEKGLELELGKRKVTLFKSGQYKIIKHEKGSLKLLKDTWASGSVLLGNASGKYFDKYISPRKSIDGIGCLYKVEGIGEDGLGYRYFTGPKKESATKGQFYSGIPLTRLEELNYEGSSKKYKPIVNFYDMSGDFGNIRHEGSVDFRAGKKPVKMIKEFINFIDDKDYICLDFFSGSATSAHAIMQANSDDSGSRRFILVQIPEVCGMGTDYYNAGFKNICEIGKERIRRAGKKVKEESLTEAHRTSGSRQKGSEKNKETLFDSSVNSVSSVRDKLDIGFKVFRLSNSNYKKWQNYTGTDIRKTEDLFAQYENPLVDNWKEEDLLTEIMLTEGFPLDSTITVIKDFKKNNVMQITSDFCEHSLFICLDKTINAETIKALALSQHDIFICLDNAVTDQDKVRLDDKGLIKTI
ncbi:MAG: site-specific DNA-methyltransferase [Treponema sp.]|nr:site-specific DNA-methyltransferase [Treponema sp.]